MLATPYIPTLAAYLHRIDPFAIQFGEDAGIRWYGLSYLAGFLAAYLIIRALARPGRSPLPRAKAPDFIFTVALATVVGGRLGYCIFYDPAKFIDFSPDFPFWGVLAIHQGGMASHGGIAGIAVGALLYARRQKLPLTHLLDLCAFGGVIGVAFGRLANFVNGELIGKVASAKLPWAVKFPQAMLDWPTRHPEKLQQLTPVIEQLRPEEMGILIDAETWRSAATAADPSKTDWVYAVLYRLVELVQRDDVLGERVAGMLRPLLEPRHPSQIYAAIFEGLFVFAVLAAIWARPRRPGVVGAWFLIVYSVVRIAVDPFRIPDPAIEHALVGLSRVQSLSILTALVGGFYLYFAARRPTPKLGGWWKGPTAQE
jgi:phosphatidylglycerol:prolipoprotein diacylglycerol transferase